MVEECDVERVHCEHLDILQRKTGGVRLLILISLAFQILVKLMIPQIMFSTCAAPNV